MEHLAQIFFHGSLNDFLPKNQKSKGIPYAFSGNPSLKDALEALGVPHPEIGSIRQNGMEAGFQEKLLANAMVEAYPVVLEGSGKTLPLLQVPAQVPASFVLDVHLGKLARYLRLLGFDTLYENHYDDQTIGQIAAQERRIVLTRDIGLLKQKVIPWGYWLRSQHLEAQLQEVLIRFGLMPQLQPFTRCIACNGQIQEVSKQSVLPLLPPKTRQYFQVFFQCAICQRVYWKGSHYEKMESFLHHLKVQ
ncbi:Mut7-C RNAse domain-containing protein [Rufibacter latericius]|uniref:Twitching motility protein PilT n=1 Tax=Rufibacter latericius TaxID=2487040 RepID=A0A3M9N0P5_9BACT|nr:Mut7-C RNAse domain-containing protein [Rufibacter latericius]RNI30578.1 hypothetical protein EFB08_04835 [Rufibacter latericius]